LATRLSSVFLCLKTLFIKNPDSILMSIKRFFSLLFILPLKYLHAQPLSYYKSITTANGLPSNYVFDVKEDKQGYIWAATDKGLARYNGNSWKIWDIDNGLPGNYVTQILPDGDNGMWVANSEKGIFYFDISNNKFYPLRSATKPLNGLIFNDGGAFYLQSLANKSSSTIYFSLHFDKKLAKAGMVSIADTSVYSPQQMQAIKLPNHYSKKLFANRLLLTALHIAEHGNNAKLIPLSHIFKKRNHLAAVQKFNSKYYYTQFGEGLAIVDSATQQVTYCNKETGLPNMQINNVFVNNKGDVYLSSFGDGIIVLQNKSNRFIALNEKPVYHMTSSAGKLFFLNDEKLFVQQHNRIEQIVLHEAPLAFLIQGDTLYTGSFKGLHIHKLTGNKVTLLKTFSITAGISSIFLSNGLLRFSSYGSGISTVSGNAIIEASSFPFNNIEKAMVLPNENIVALSYESGFFIADKNLSLKKHFTVKDGLPSNEVRNVVWHNDTLWVCCKKGIAVVYQNKIIKIYTAANGLKGKLVKNILFHKNDVFAVTNSHIHLFKNNKFTIIKSFLAKNGEQKNITATSVISGNLYTALSDGISIIPAYELLNVDMPPTPVFNYAVQNVDTLSTHISLPFGYGRSDFYYGSLSADITGKTQLWYKINGAEWTAATDSNTIGLNNLNSGKYHLLVKSINQNGTESEIAEPLLFAVAKPWYQRWWALVSALLMVAFGMFRLAQLYSRQKYKKRLRALKLQEELENERQRISRDLHDNMGAYTSALIANVQQLKTTIGENEQTQKMQANAESILNSLRETIWVLNNKEVTLQEFNDEFKNYCFKVLRNFEHINFTANESINHNQLLKASQVIHLNKIMQEAIQNCIKHADASVINYSISDVNGLEIIIADNGKGFNQQQSATGFGLDNMQWRANEAGLRLIINTTPNGTSIRINTL
jgi:signal transduction histidine kinase